MTYLEIKLLHALSIASSLKQCKTTVYHELKQEKTMRQKWPREMSNFNVTIEEHYLLCKPLNIQSTNRHHKTGDSTNSIEMYKNFHTIEHSSCAVDDMFPNVGSGRSTDDELSKLSFALKKIHE